MASQDEKDVIPRTKVVRGKKMNSLLKHFTVVGDDYHTWNVNYKRWENEEEEEPVPAPALGEVSSVATDVEASAVPVSKKPLDFRSLLRKLFSCHRFQVIIICLVVLDALLVLTQLILDLKIIETDKENEVIQVLHYLSIFILFFFVVEISLKIYVFRQEFFHHKFEILDAVVVIISFVLDVLLLFQGHDLEALNLLILLRLWRVARILNGIIISVKTRAEQQLLRLKQINIHLAAKIQHLEFSCSEKEQEIERLNQLLRQHGLLEDAN